MKKIVKSNNSNIVSFEDVSAMEFPNVGFLDNGVSKGFLVPEHYYDYGTTKKTVLYYARAVSSFSKGNGWGSSYSKTLEGWFNFFGEGGDFYLFDSPKELFKWLSE